MDLTLKWNPIRGPNLKSVNHEQSRLSRSINVIGPGADRGRAGLGSGPTRRDATAAHERSRRECLGIGLPCEVFQ